MGATFSETQPTGFKFPDEAADNRPGLRDETARMDPDLLDCACVRRPVRDGSTREEPGG